MTETTFGSLTEATRSLFTDRSELQLMQASHRQDHNPTATFCLFVRSLPENRGYMVAAGLEQAQLRETMLIDQVGHQTLEARLEDEAASRQRR